MVGKNLMLSSLAQQALCFLSSVHASWRCNGLYILHEYSGLLHVVFGPCWWHSSDKSDARQHHVRAVSAVWSFAIVFGR